MLMNFKILEVLICIIFLYLLLSLLVTTIQELLSSLLKLRSKELEKGITRMLGDENQLKLPTDFFNHWMIKYLSKNEKQKPSYISRTDFSKALVDILKHTPDIRNMDDVITEAIAKLPDGDTKSLINSFWEDSKKDVNEFRKSIEGWFDSTMDRVSGWYKRIIQRFVFGIGLVIVILFNVDTFQVYETLSNDDTKRVSLVEMAKVYSDMYEKKLEENRQNAGAQKADATTEDIAKSINEIQEELVKMNSDCNTLGLGWSNCGGLFPLNISNWQNYLQKVLGWLVTALAITLGAPFWFDMLQKTMNIRNAGKKPDSEKNTA